MHRHVALLLVAGFIAALFLTIVSSSDAVSSINRLLANQEYLQIDILDYPQNSIGLGNLQQPNSSGATLNTTATVTNSVSGLWVGSASIDHVGQAANTGTPTNVGPTDSAFQFRLIVHVDAAGQARLLQHVTLMRQKDELHQGTPSPSLVDTDMDEDGRLVLVTDDMLLLNQNELSGVEVRDGKLVGRRISSAAFSFSSPITLAGAFGTQLQSEPIVIGTDDPLNPFKHKYHTSHDNLSADFQRPLLDGSESFTITRQIDLDFISTDEESELQQNCGTDSAFGSYREQVDGVHKNSLIVSGTFCLQNVSPVDILNDGR